MLLRWVHLISACMVVGDYVKSTTPGGHDTQNLFPKAYKDYPGGVESFDVYSPPITTLYSQVHPPT